MSQRTPPKSKMTPSRLVLAFRGGRLAGIRRLHGRRDVAAQRSPTALLHTALVENLLLVGARDAIALEVRRRVVHVGLVPLLVGLRRGACRQHQCRRGEEKRQ